MSSIHDRDKQIKRVQEKMGRTAVRIAWWASGIYKNEFLKDVLKEGVSESELLETIIYEHYKRKNV